MKSDVSRNPSLGSGRVATARQFSNAFAYRERVRVVRLPACLTWAFERDEQASTQIWPQQVCTHVVPPAHWLWPPSQNGAPSQPSTNVPQKQPFPLSGDTSQHWQARLS